MRVDTNHERPSHLEGNPAGTTLERLQTIAIPPELGDPLKIVRDRIVSVSVPDYPTRQIKGGSDGPDGYNF